MQAYALTYSLLSWGKCQFCSFGGSADVSQGYVVVHMAMPPILSKALPYVRGMQHERLCLQDFFSTLSLISYVASDKKRNEFWFSCAVKNCQHCCFSFTLFVSQVPRFRTDMCLHYGLYMSSLALVFLCSPRFFLQFVLALTFCPKLHWSM